QGEILPYRLLLPLTELGLDMHTLIDKNTTQHLITTTELQKLFPRGKVQRRHKVALNRLSLAVSALCPNAPHTPAHKPCKWTCPLPLEDRRLREIPDTPTFTSLKHKTTLPTPILAPSLDPHVHRNMPVTWNTQMQHNTSTGTYHTTTKTQTHTPSLPAEHDDAGRKRKKSHHQQQQEFINNNTRCDNKQVETMSAAIHEAQLHDLTTENPTSYMLSRKVMTALQQDTKKCIPHLGQPPEPKVQGPRPNPEARTR
ncbi:hypothetical protein Vafri_5584, partial [Volvox africanus]